MTDTAYDTIVTGAGAAGMMAAITAARRGKSVLVLEQLADVGKKLLATGNGKCNFTNGLMSPKFYHGDQALIESVLSRFSPDDCLAFFREIGVFPKNKRGYYYPNSEQASSVKEALVAELARCGVTLAVNASVCGVTPTSYGWLCRTSSESYRGKTVIFATGLLASPKLGSDGSAIPMLKALGHRFMPILPALCGFRCEGMNFRRVSGVRCDTALTLAIDGQTAGRERGELQLADYGLSGIPMFQLSSAAVRALYEKRTVTVYLDFLPDLDHMAVAGELQRRKERGSRAGQFLCGLVNSKLGGELLSAAGLQGAVSADDYPDAGLKRLISLLKGYPVVLTASRGMEHAQVCTGGIRTGEIDTDTLESKLCPGLYFAGELLDADGICGGYNLHWAWATGHVAGSCV